MHQKLILMFIPILFVISLYLIVTETTTHPELTQETVPLENEMTLASENDYVIPPNNIAEDKLPSDTQVNNGAEKPFVERGDQKADSVTNESPSTSDAPTISIIAPQKGFVVAPGQKFDLVLSATNCDLISVAYPYDFLSTECDSLDDIYTFNITASLDSVSELHVAVLARSGTEGNYIFGNKEISFAVDNGVIAGIMHNSDSNGQSGDTFLVPPPEERFPSTLLIYKLYSDGNRKVLGHDEVTLDQYDGTVIRIETEEELNGSYKVYGLKQGGETTVRARYKNFETIIPVRVY